MSNVEVNFEEDCIILEGNDPQAPAATVKEDDNVEQQKKKAKTYSSECWKHFDRLPLTEDGKEMCKCKACGKEFTGSSTAGTSHLNLHILRCKKIPKFDNVGTMMLDYTAKMRSRKLDDKVVRDMIAQMIVLHDLPFQCVEWQGFRSLCQYLSFGEATHISRNSITGDVMKIYMHEKQRLKGQLARHNGSVCFTSDCWTSCTTRGYITLTAHFIDENWKLNSKLLSFCHLEPPHTGHELSRKLLELLKEWGVERKVFSITLDNATSNTSMQSIMKKSLCMSSSLLCNGEFFHIRCCSHILNLIVQEGLKVASNALYKIRESVKYVRGSESRKIQFVQCVEKIGSIDSSVGLRLDVPTRWNSTYLMLQSAIVYSRAFACLDIKDEHYKHCPTNEDWERGMKIRQFLEPFYEITNMFSGSKYPTSNLYFMQVWKIEILLKNNKSSQDRVISEMATNMMDKFNRYWSEHSTILAMACVLDPRMKLKWLKYAYSKLYSNNIIVDEKLSIVKNALYKLFNYYVNNMEAPPSMTDASTSTGTYKEGEGTSTLTSDYDDFEEEENAQTLLTGKSELDTYLEESKLVGHKDLNVLEYWRDNSGRFGDLSRMASDVLTIPITTVASESTFSIGGRILSKYRSSLLSKNLEALICARNWLLGFSQNGGLSSIDGANERTTQVNDNTKANERTTQVNVNNLIEEEDENEEFF